jgi:integrase
MGYPFGPMVRLLILTGLRRNEVAHARWSEFDLENAIWTIPAERMKSDAAHAVPLTSEMLAILQTLPRRGDHLFVSGRRSDRPISGFSAMKARLDELMGEIDPWTLHDIRRTMRTHLSSLPIPELVRELVIAHTKPGLHKVYDQHAYLDEKRDALEQWAKRLRGIIDPPTGNVVALRVG